MRVRPNARPGAQVYDYTNKVMVDCTAALCPYATGSPLVNAPAFFGSGGFATAIGGAVPEDVQQMLFDFLAYMNSPEQSVDDTATMGFMDPYRYTHIANLSNYERLGWPTKEATDLMSLETVRAPCHPIARRLPPLVLPDVAL